MDYARQKSSDMVLKSAKVGASVADPDNFYADPDLLKKPDPDPDPDPALCKIWNKKFLPKNGVKDL
jgi:hypothetical protein